MVDPAGSGRPAPTGVERQQGQPFDSLVVALAELAVGIALRYLPEDEAAEVGQDAVAAYLHRHDEIINPEGYVATVAMRSSWRRQSKRRRLAVVDPVDLADQLADPAQADDFEQILGTIVFEERLEEVFGLLTPREGQVFAARLDGLSRTETAERLEIGEETVKKASPEQGRGSSVILTPTSGRTGCEPGTDAQGA